MFFPYHPGEERAAEAGASGDDDGVGRAAGVPGAAAAHGLPPEGRAADGAHGLPRGAADQPRVAQAIRAGSDALLLPAAGKLPQPTPTLQPYGGWGARAAAAASLSGTGCRPSLRRPRAAPATIAGRVRRDGPRPVPGRGVGISQRVSSERVCGDRASQGAVGALLRDAQAARWFARGASLLGVRLALTVALKLSEHLRGRVEKMLAAGGEQRWGVYQPGGGRDERGAHSARRRHEPFVGEFGKRFGRPCSSARSPSWAPRPSAVQRKRSRRCTPIRTSRDPRPPPATGDGRARGGACGGGPRRTQRFAYLCDGRLDVARRGWALDSSVAPSRSSTPRLLEPRPPRDVRESQLDAHLALDHGVGRRRRRRRRGGEVLSHAEYFERTLLNAVLGTQRGTTPGSMLYMLPMGSGVSRRASRARRRGTTGVMVGILLVLPGQWDRSVREVHDSVFWLSPTFAARGGGGAEHVFILQHMSSELVWSELGVRLTLTRSSAARGENGPLTTTLTVTALADDPARRPRPPLVVWLRLPSWAEGRAGARHREPPRAEPGRRRAASAAAGGGWAAAGAVLGRAGLRLEASLRWEQVKDTRAEYQLLHAALHGNLLLAGLTYGERALHAGTKLQPVPRAPQGARNALTRPPGPRCAAWGAGRRLTQRAASSQDGRMFGSCGPRTSAARLSTSGRSRLRRRRRASGARRPSTTSSLNGRSAAAATAVVHPRRCRGSDACALDGCVDGKKPFASGTPCSCTTAAPGRRCLPRRRRRCPGCGVAHGRTNGNVEADVVAARHGAAGGRRPPPTRGIRLARQRAGRHL